jgi:hypothetical protein
MKRLIHSMVVLCMTALIFSFTSANTTTRNALPNPVLYFIAADYLTIGGVNMTRYHFDVANKDAYPAEMFAASPSLPPCGSNTKASRTWVDIYDQRGKRLNGFCALGKPDDLHGIWFAMATDDVPPSYVYIEFNDRQTNTKYRSNLAETTQ